MLSVYKLSVNHTHDCPVTTYCILLNNKLQGDNNTKIVVAPQNPENASVAPGRRSIDMNLCDRSTLTITCVNAISEKKIFSLSVRLESFLVVSVVGV